MDSVDAAFRHAYIDEVNPVLSPFVQAFLIPVYYHYPLGIKNQNECVRVRVRVCVCVCFIPMPILKSSF